MTESYLVLSQDPVCMFLCCPILKASGIRVDNFVSFHQVHSWRCLKFIFLVTKRELLEIESYSLYYWLLSYVASKIWYAFLWVTVLLFHLVRQNFCIDESSKICNVYFLDPSLMMRDRQKTLKRHMTNVLPSDLPEKKQKFGSTPIDDFIKQ